MDTNMPNLPNPRLMSVRPVGEVVPLPPDVPAGTPVQTPKPDASDPRVVDIDLIEPITVSGSETAQLQLDFRRLTPRTLRNIEDEIRESGDTVMPNPFLSLTYCQYLGARAAGLTLDDFDLLGFEDAFQVTQAVQNFSARSAARSRQK